MAQFERKRKRRPEPGRGADRILILNDQGGARMDVSADVVHTLREQNHGHPPLIYDARGNGGGTIAPTITGDHQNRVTDYTAVIVTYEEDVSEHRIRLVE